MIFMKNFMTHCPFVVSVTQYFVFGRKRSTRFSVGMLCALSLSACGPSPDSTVDTTRLTGRDIYLTRCTACHQMDGSGIPRNCPPFHGSPRLAGPSNELIRLMLLGKHGPLERDGKIYNGIMPSWRADLSDAQVAEVLNHVLTTWTPQPRKVAAEDVAKVRAETANSKLLPSEK